MNEEKWVRRSLSSIAQQLVKRWFHISQTTVRRLLKKLRYGLYRNGKSLTGKPHLDCDRQFRYIVRMKKELVGNFLNPGRSWKIEAEKVNVHDFKQRVTSMLALLTMPLSLPLTPLPGGELTQTGLVSYGKTDSLS